MHSALEWIDGEVLQSTVGRRRGTRDWDLTWEARDENKIKLHTVSRHVTTVPLAQLLDYKQARSRIITVFTFTAGESARSSGANQPLWSLRHVRHVRQAPPR